MDCCFVPFGSGEQVEKGSTVAVWGLGCVGLGVALGAREAGAAKVVGIDTNENKYERARRLGCTEFVNPNALPAGVASLQQHLTAGVTDGGFDFTFECIGNVNCMRAALEACHKGIVLRLLLCLSSIAK